MIQCTPTSQVLTNFPQNFWWKAEFFSLTVRERSKKVQSRSFSWNLSYGDWECSLDNIAKRFLAIKPKTLFHAKRSSRKQFFADKASFSQKIPWDTLNPVLTTLPEFWDKRLLFYCSRTGNEKKIQKNLSSKWSFGRLECKPWQPYWKNYVKGQTFFAENRKKVEKTIIFKKI